MKKKYSILGTLFLMLSLLAVFPVKTEAANPSSKVVVVTIGELERVRARAVVESVNKERAAKNLDPLVMTDEMETVAVQRAVELSAYFEHTRPNGESCMTVMDDYELEYGVGTENIAGGYSTASAVMDAWMDSKGHRENILDPDFTHIGVACFEVDSVRYWVQFFASEPSSSTDAETNVTNSYEIAWPYEVDTNFMEGCTLEFLEKEATINLGEKKEFDLVLYDSEDYFLGVVYSDELDTENGGLVVEGSDILSVSENYFVVDKEGKTGTAKVTANVGTLSASKTIKIACKHKGETTLETKEATCKETGYEKTVCNACGEVISTKTLDKLAHEFEGSAVTPAGFGKEGKISGSCSVCEEAVDVVIPAVEKPTLAKDTFTYSGDRVEVDVTVKDTLGKELSSDDYSYAVDGDATKPGIYNVTVTLKGNYEGSETVEFKVLPKAVEDANAGLYKWHDDMRVYWDKVEHATGYNVYYKKSDSNTKKFYGSTENTEVIIKDLSDNTEYDFYVYSYYDDGEERLVSKNAVKVTRKTMRYLAKPEDAKVILTGYDDIKITWKKVKNASKYIIFYKRNDAKTYSYLGETTKLEFSKKNLRDGAKYTFRITPAYIDKEFSEYSGGERRGFESAEVSIYTLKQMDKPSIEKTSSKEIKLTWENINGESGYQISRSTSKTGTNPVSATSKTYKVYTPTRNVTYYYKIRAYKTVNGVRIYGPWSDVSAYSLRSVGKASNVKAVLSGGYDDIKVSWSKATGANKYKIYVKSSVAPEYKLLKETTSTSIKLKNFKDGVKYTFKVVPVYELEDEVLATGTSATSYVYTLKELNAPVVKKSTAGKVKVSWNNISGETGYQISRSTSKTGTNIVSTYKTTSGKEKVVTATNGKTYYYKVRAYKTVNGVNIYGPWSEVVKYVR